MRIVGMCIVVAFAISAVASATASAAGGPLWYECGKAAKVKIKYTLKGKEKEKAIQEGQYTENACKTLAPEKTGQYPPYEGPEGKYQLVEGVGKGKEFKGTGSGEIYLEAFNPVLTLKIKCTSVKDQGRAVLPDLEAKVQAIYKGCEVLGNKCTTLGMKAGEIKTPLLAGELGYLNTPGKVVGMLLSNEASPGGEMAKFNCTVFRVEVTGAVINTLTEKPNEIHKEATSTYAGGKYLGEVESPFGKFEPVTNPPVFENEYLKLIKNEQAPNILSSVGCGPVVEENLHEECTPLAIPSAQNQTTTEKGEMLMIKA